MDTKMIINCRAPCVWTRLRDKILYLLSLLLWTTLLLLLFRVEISELVYFFTSFYLVMVLLVTVLLVAWSHYRKTVFHFFATKQNRRTRFTLLRPHVAAKYFCIEEKYLCVLQYEKSTVIRHGKDGHISSVLFHHQLIDLPVLFDEDKVHYSAVA